MDVKDEDTSEESLKNHITYYRSLTRIVAEIQKERTQQVEPAIKAHLDSRIEAIKKDQKRIRDTFPDIPDEEWD